MSEEDAAVLQTVQLQVRHLSARLVDEAKIQGFPFAGEGLAQSTASSSGYSCNPPSQIPLSTVDGESESD